MEITNDIYEHFVDHIPVGELVSTDESPFWYVGNRTNNFMRRYVHEKGKVRDHFYDGNNGDRWEVLAINTQYRRIIVVNLTQGGVKLCYWE